MGLIKFCFIFTLFSIQPPKKVFSVFWYPLDYGIFFAQILSTCVFKSFPISFSYLRLLIFSLYLISGKTKLPEACTGRFDFNQNISYGFQHINWKNTHSNTMCYHFHSALSSRIESTSSVTLSLCLFQSAQHCSITTVTLNY